MELKFIQSGSTLINFAAGAYNIERFDPGTPELRDERVSSVFHHGEEVLYVRHKNAIATLNLMVLGATAAACDTAVQAISTVLSDILALRGTGGEPIYIRFGPQGSSESFDSELYAVRMLQSDNRAQEPYERASKYGTTDSFFRKITLVMERAPWWQALALTELSLANGHGSGTGGIEIRNSDDSSNDNFAQITGSTILGTERTPLKLKITRDVLGTDRCRKVHISRNGRYTPNSAKLVYEIESATAHYGNYSNVADTKYSNGNATRWNPMSTTYDFKMLYGSITGTNMQIYRGRWFHVLLTVDNLSTNDTARVRFALFLGTNEVASTDWYDIRNYPGQNGEGVHDIGAIKIPPTYLGNIQHMTLTYELHGYDPNNTSTDITFDCIHLMPSEPEDGYMVGEMWGWYLGNQDGYIFDGDRRNTYGFLAPTPTYMDYVTMTGKYIEVVPGEDCRLVLVWDKYDTGAYQLFASADETYIIQAWYRKRILHI